MALQERIFGIETEYAINFYPAKTGGNEPSSQTIVGALQSVLAQNYGIDSSPYLITGGKFFHDVGHAEWAHPECRSAHEAATYDKATDHLLAHLLPEAQGLLSQHGYQGHLLIAKNNVDFNGSTYGCHENYLMLKDSELLTGEYFLRYLARTLIPFLVTRQLFAGSGRLVFAENQLSYEISQRAAFIDTIVSAETTKDRPIFNTGREREPLAGGNARRLHLILGDANLSGWATWMKLGTTGIILRMIEDMFIVDLPLLQDPLAALRSIASDSTCRTVLPLRDRRLMSALDIQNFYYERADAYLAEYGCTDEEDALMDAWENALNDLAQDPMKLRNRADWVMKKRFLDAHLSQANLSWEQTVTDQSVINRLQAYDLRFHDISREGLFNQVSYPDTLITQDEIQMAQRQPPPYTRARIRGEAITLARRYQIPVTVERWGELVVNGKKIEVPDPLEFDHPDLPFYGTISVGQSDQQMEEERLQQELVWLHACAAHQNPFLRSRTTAYLSWRKSPEATAILREMVLHDASEMVRIAAVVALGQVEDTTATDLLVDLLGDATPAIRWAAQEILEGMHQEDTSSPPPPQNPPDGDDGEPLIQLIP
jgi:proteasome accessory factor A